MKTEPEHLVSGIDTQQPTLWIEDSGGVGTPLMLISGLGYSSWCWTELREALSADYRVITFDNRGTGRSDKPAGPYSISMLADDAARVLDYCGIPDAHVLGHSMGGYIALTLALRHPGKVCSLTLVGTAAGGPGCLPVPRETRAAWLEASALAPELYARRTMPYSFAPGWTEAHPQRFEKYLKRRLEYPTPPECWAAQYQACETYGATGVDAACINTPALVVHGDTDCVVPHVNGEMLAEQLPNAGFISLRGIGHLPYLEDLETFTALLRDFLPDPVSHAAVSRSAGTE